MLTEQTNNAQEIERLLRHAFNFHPNQPRLPRPGRHACNKMLLPRDSRCQAGTPATRQTEIRGVNPEESNLQLTWRCISIFSIWTICSWWRGARPKPSHSSKPEEDSLSPNRMRIELPPEKLHSLRKLAMRVLNHGYGTVTKQVFALWLPQKRS